MFSSPIVYAWIAWLLVVGVIAVLRFAAHQREERRQAERRPQRRTGQAARSAPDKASIVKFGENDKATAGSCRLPRATGRCGHHPARGRPGHIRSGDPGVTRIPAVTGRLTIAHTHARHTRRACLSYWRRHHARLGQTAR